MMIVIRMVADAIFLAGNRGPDGIGESQALEEELKVRERDRVLIKEARQRRIVEKEREKQEAEEQRKRLERARLEGEIAKRRELNVRVREEQLEADMEQRRIYEAQVITQARSLRMQSKDAEKVAREREREIGKREVDLKAGV